MKPKDIIAQPLDRRPSEMMSPRRAAHISFGLGMGIFFSALCLAQVHAQPRVPDFTGVWGHNDFSFRKPYGTITGDVVDGYNNEYLKPWVAELVMRDNIMDRSGRVLVTDHSACFPEGTPGELGNPFMQILQTPSEITMLFSNLHYRIIYLNRPHTPHLIPSWYGESVGHFEGDSLVVDTTGIALTPQKISSFYGTPHTEALHVVEHWRFLSADEKPMPALPRGALFSFPINPNQVVAGGKTLRLTLTMTDPGAYRKPWTATLDYQPLKTTIAEFVCQENNRDFEPFTPTADIPDF